MQPMRADIGHELIELGPLDQRENVGEGVKFERAHFRSSKAIAGVFIRKAVRSGAGVKIVWAGLGPEKIPLFLGISGVCLCELPLRAHARLRPGPRSWPRQDLSCRIAGRRTV